MERKAQHKEFLSILRGAPVYLNKNHFDKTGDGKRVIRKGQNWYPEAIKDGTYAYCVLPDGEVRLSESPRPQSSISHPELVGNKAVIAAGMLEVKEGSIQCIDNQSGHYEPDGDSINFALIAFRYWNIPLSSELRIDTRWSLFRK